MTRPAKRDSSTGPTLCITSRSVVRFLGLLALTVMLAACGGSGSPLPPMELASLTPSRVSIERNTTLTLTGAGLIEGDALGGLRAQACGAPLEDLQVQGESKRFLIPPAGSTRVTVGSSATAILPAGGATGTSDLILQRADGARVVLPEAIECVSEEEFVNDAPAANALSVNATENQPVDLRLTGSDPEGEPLTYRIAEEPEHGLLSALDAKTGKVTYTPDTNWNGTDSFTFTVSDGEVTSAPAMVTIEVSAINDEPEILEFEAKEIQAHHGLPVIFSWRASDPDSEELRCELDVDGDGTPEYSLNPCPETGQQLWLYPEHTATYEPTLTVRDDLDSASTGLSAPLEVVREVWGQVAAGPEHAFEIEEGGVITSRASGSITGTEDPAAPAGSGWIGVAAGGRSLVALHGDGSVTATGAYAEQLPPLSGVIDLAAGSDVMLALHEDGTVAAWGDPTSPATVVPAGLANVSAIAAGNDFAVAVRGDGSVTAWGRNDHGQTEVPVGLSEVVAVAAGNHHALALRADGSVVAWGRAEEGQTAVPSDLSDVIAVRAGFTVSVAVKADGTITAWGGEYTEPIWLANNMMYTVEDLDRHTLRGELIDLAFDGVYERTGSDGDEVYGYLSHILFLTYERDRPDDPVGHLLGHQSVNRPVP